MTYTKPEEKPMAQYSVSIIIPAFNEERYIDECLKAITNQHYNDLISQVEIVVVDNESTDATTQIASNYDSVKIISSSAKYVGGVRNDGVKITSGEILIFLDSDCVVDKDWVVRCVGLLEESGKDAVGGQYLLRSDPSFFEKYWILDSSENTVLYTTLIGGCLITNRAAFDTVGGFSEELTAGEDEDYSRKINSLEGYAVKPELSVVHLGFPNSFLGFWRRQVWQSSSYAQNFFTAITQLSFCLIGLHATAFITFIVSDKNSYMPYLSGFGLVVIPAIFSIKRIIRSKHKPARVLDLLGIYFVDWIYITARQWGICKSLVESCLKLNIAKARKK